MHPTIVNGVEALSVCRRLSHSQHSQYESKAISRVLSQIAGPVLVVGQQALL